MSTPQKPISPGSSSIFTIAIAIIHASDEVKKLRLNFASISSAGNATEAGNSG